MSIITANLGLTKSYTLVNHRGNFTETQTLGQQSQSIAHYLFCYTSPLQMLHLEFNDLICHLHDIVRTEQHPEIFLEV